MRESTGTGSARPLRITNGYQTVYESNDCRVSLAVIDGRLQMLVEDHRMGELDGRRWFAHASSRNFAIKEVTSE